MRRQVTVIRNRILEAAAAGRAMTISDDVLDGRRCFLARVDGFLVATPELETAHQVAVTGEGGGNGYREQQLQHAGGAVRTLRER
jgi:hypothetical protein